MLKEKESQHGYGSYKLPALYSSYRNQKVWSLFDFFLYFVSEDICVWKGDIFKVADIRL